MLEVVGEIQLHGRCVEMIMQADELMNRSNGSYSFLYSYYPNFGRSKASILSVKADTGEIFPKHRL